MHDTLPKILSGVPNNSQNNTRSFFTRTCSVVNTCDLMLLVPGLNISENANFVHENSTCNSCSNRNFCNSNQSNEQQQEGISRMTSMALSFILFKVGSLPALIAKLF